MNKILCLCLILICFPVTGFAQAGTQFLFDEANSKLEEGNFMDALNIYRQIEQTEQVSGALFLNMGIAAAQLDSMGLAKYYFLKSSRFESTADRSVQALEYVTSQFSRQSAVLPKLPWDRAVDWLKDEPGATGVFMLGYLLTLVAISIVLISWFTSFRLRRFTLVISSFAISGLTIILLAFYVNYVDMRYSQAVIIQTETPVKRLPSDTSDLVSLGYEGYSITVDNYTSAESEDWYYIRLGNGQYGWVARSGTKIL